jgi:hypothetical protein
MTYKATGPWIGAQAFTDTRTTAEHILGTRVRGVSPTLGEGEFIYLKGVVSTAVGDAVVFDEAFATTRAIETSRGQVAIAMSANVANQYGWYQVMGVATVNAATVVADAPVSLTTTAGQLDDLTTAQYAVVNARWMSATNTPATGFAYAMITNPIAAGMTNIG